MEYIAIDFETTGLSDSADEVIEIGAVKFNEYFEVISEFQTFIKPKRKVPAEATSIHGITNEMLKDSPKVKVAWINFMEWCNGSLTFICHNASFEASFMVKIAPKKDFDKILFIDTLKISKERLKSDSYSLSNLVPELKNEAHRALPDAKACITLLNNISQTYDDNSFPFDDCLTSPSVLLSKANDPAPTDKQLSYIEKLGGKPSAISTKSEASLYIDELKQGDTSRTNRGAAPNTFISILMFIYGSLFLLMGILNLGGNIILGIGMAIAGLVVLPYAGRKMYAITKKSLTTKTKFKISVAILITVILVSEII
jgi:DNA polymerase III epsilon subunit family exonuclease